MPLTIPDKTLDGLRSAARDALIDMACRLYDADRISKPEATRMTGLSRIDFEDELTRRGLPAVHLEYDETMRRELDEIRQRWSKPKVPGT